LYCYFIQAYGLTETTVAGYIQNWLDVKSGNIDIVIRCNEAKMRNVPELGCHAPNFTRE
jgi:long-subunit acyl-CoA synthetase (AMP-forming)